MWLEPFFELFNFNGVQYVVEEHFCKNTVGGQLSGMLIATEGR